MPGDHDVLRNIANAEASLKNKQYQLVADHLGVAKWNVEQVKKAITLVGQSKTKRPALKLTSQFLTPAKLGMAHSADPFNESAHIKRSI